MRVDFARDGYTMPNQSSYYHQIPGRMRVTVANLQGDAARATALEAGLQAHPGIRSSRANALTGNVLISYNPAVASATAVLALLSQLDHAPLVQTNSYAAPTLPCPREHHHAVCETCGGTMAIPLDPDRALLRKVGKQVVKTVLQRAFTGPVAGAVLELF
jgi:hypothetical protein